MAIAAADEDAVVDTIRAALNEVELRLVEIDDIAEASLENFPDYLDEHLGENVKSWEPNKRTVWGTIHVYLADGEA